MPSDDSACAPNSTTIRFTLDMELYELFRRHSRISTDSRHIVPDSLFFALHGERFDTGIFGAEHFQSLFFGVQRCAFFPD